MEGELPARDPGAAWNWRVVAVLATSSSREHIVDRQSSELTGPVINNMPSDGGMLTASRRGQYWTGDRLVLTREPRSCCIEDGFDSHKVIREGVVSGPESSWG